MGALFNTFLYQPIFNIFILLYNIIPDVGLVIILITVVIKTLLYPLNAKSIKAQRSLSEIQPKLDELKRKYKDDQQTLAQETMKLYKNNKVNPFGSCLPILIQLPIFLALYWTLRNGLATDNFDLLYSFVKTPTQLNAVSFGIIDLSKPQWTLAVLAGAAQFWQAKTLSHKKAPKAAGKGGKDENMMAMMNKQMLYVMPFLTVFISLKLPGGVALYWFLSTLYTAIQQMILKSREKKTAATEIIDQS